VFQASEDHDPSSLLRSFLALNRAIEQSDKVDRSSICSQFFDAGIQATLVAAQPQIEQLLFSLVSKPLPFAYRTLVVSAFVALFVGHGDRRSLGPLLERLVALLGTKSALGNPQMCAMEAIEDGDGWEVHAKLREIGRLSKILRGVGTDRIGGVRRG